MVRAIAALFTAAFAFSTAILGLGLHQGIGSAWYVGTMLCVSVLVLGLPTLVLFCKRHWWEPWRFVLGGTLGGALCALPFAGSGNFNFVYLVVILALAGSVFGLPFWLAAVWRNENLTCPKEFCLPCGAAYRFARGVLRRPSKS